MRRDALDPASCWFRPDSDRRFLGLNQCLTCHYFRLSFRLGWPHSIGAFLPLPRSVHFTIVGFDTSILVAEDQDHVRGIARPALYGFMRPPVVTVAARRFEAEGGLGTSLKWLGIEMHRAVLGEIRGEYFRYFK